MTILSGYQQFNNNIPLNLQREHLHVWRLHLEAGSCDEDHLLNLLSLDEQQRAERFIFSEDRHRFILARAALRVLLGRYTMQPPEQLRFHYNDYGKPMLLATAEQGRINFNLSHSRDWALFAFCLEHDIGIDIEYIDDQLDHEQLAGSFFSELEQQQLASLPEAARPEAFFQIWTRKEAYIKAHGRGLSIPLDSFSVSSGPEEVPRLISCRASHVDPSEWQFRELRPTEGYLGALAVPCHECTLVYWQSNLTTLTSYAAN